MPDPSVILGYLGVWQLWLVCATGFGLGALGGIVHARTTDPGTLLRFAAAGAGSVGWTDGIIGGVAALGVLSVSTPATGLAFVGGSLVAGYAGKAVLAGLQARTMLSAARREAIDKRRDVEAALGAAEDFHRALESCAPASPAALTISLVGARKTLRALQAKYQDELL